MKPISLQDVRQAVAGKSLNALSPTAPKVDAVCTDTGRWRRTRSSSHCTATTSTGHQYLNQAFAGGAVAAIVEVRPEGTPDGTGLSPGSRHARRDWGSLPSACRQDLKGRVIAVAGSNGKTQHQAPDRAALSGDPSDKLVGRSPPRDISPKSYNNDIGVPLTIFAAEHAHDYVVLEMGTNHPGEIQTLTEMARPDIAGDHQLRRGEHLSSSATSPASGARTRASSMA
jgi:UDP-N-acetylmuramoyl-tripeptide--D-alanyl-D-alanine ligase